MLHSNHLFTVNTSSLSQSVLACTHAWRDKNAALYTSARLRTSLTLVPLTLSHRVIQFLRSASPYLEDIDAVPFFNWCVPRHEKIRTQHCTLCASSNKLNFDASDVAIVMQADFCRARATVYWYRSCLGRCEKTRLLLVELNGQDWARMLVWLLVVYQSLSKMFLCRNIEEKMRLVRIPNSYCFEGNMNIYSRSYWCV